MACALAGLLARTKALRLLVVDFGTQKKSKSPECREER